MQLSRNAKIALSAFIVFDLLVASWLVYLFLARAEADDINALRELGATRYPEPTQIENFSLLDARGASFSNQDLLGSWSLVFFGFTSCPDVCPITMTELAQFYQRYEESGLDNLPKIIFVSVDPERDGVNEVAAYMERFDERFIGLSGSPDEIADVARQFYVAYSTDSDTVDGAHEGHMAPSSNSALESPSVQNEDYMVSHSVHLSVVDPEGRLHSVIRPPIRRETMMQLYPQLIED